MNWLVVIPSIRTVNLDYLAPLGDTDILIVDDSDWNIPKSGWPSRVKVMNYADRKALLGDADQLVPRKSPSCKGAGLYYAWKNGYEGAILLDDDCDASVTPDYLDRIPVGKPAPSQEYSVSGDWINTLDTLGLPHFYSRGYPYELRVEPRMPVLFDVQTKDTFPPASGKSPKFNQGMWSGTPDINGIDKIRNDHVLKREDQLVTDFDRQSNCTVTLRKNQLLPCSIMNVQIHRDLIPAFYQPPDYQLDNGWFVRRHDDVWSAMFLKFVMDEAGEIMTVGQPIIAHRKAGDERKEAVAEHCTNFIQTYLERAMRTAARGLYCYGSIAEMAIRFAYNLSMESENAPPIYAKVIQDYADRAKCWAKLF